MFLAKKVGVLIKKESESLVFTGLEIPRDHKMETEAVKWIYQKQTGNFIVSVSQTGKNIIWKTHRRICKITNRSRQRIRSFLGIGKKN